MVIDYSVVNRCNICEINYPKDVLYCINGCGRRIRTSAKVTKSEVRERVKNLASKRY